MPVERAKPDPSKLLAYWMEWEKGVAQPGQTLADLKRGGLRDVLEALAEAAPAEPETDEGTKD